jgi:uncharacterized protein YfbU (UPF0304 family)
VPCFLEKNWNLDFLNSKSCKKSRNLIKILHKTLQIRKKCLEQNLTDFTKIFLKNSLKIKPIFHHIKTSYSHQNLRQDSKDKATP